MATSCESRRPICSLLPLLFAVGTFTGCSISVKQPANGSTVTLPTAATPTHVIITGNATYNNLQVTIDGTNVSGQMVSKSGSQDEGDIPLAAGSHTLVASADVYCFYCTGKTSHSTATSTFTVAVPGPTIALSLQPNALSIERGKSGGTTVSVVRGGGFTGAVSVTVSSLAGVTANALTITSGQSSGTLTLNVGAAVASNPATLNVTGTGPGGSPVSMAVPLTLTVARTPGGFVEANPTPYTNGNVGTTVTSLSGTFAADIKTGTQVALPQPRAAVFRKGAQTVGQPVGFSVGQTSNLGGAGFCRDNTTQPTQTRGVVLTSAPPGSNADYGFTFLDLMGNINVTPQMYANGSKTNPTITAQPRVFFSPDCTLAMVTGVNRLGPSNYELNLLDLQSGNPLAGSCGSPVSFNTANAFSAQVKAAGTQRQVEVTVDPGTANAQVCTYNVP